MVRKVEPIRVLLVEDDPAVQACIRDFFEGEPRMTLAGIACDGAEGLEAISELEPDLVLLDLIMPRLSGMGLLRALAGAPPERRPRVVVMSQVNSQEIIGRTLELGADFYLVKPVRLTELPDLILGLCGEKRREPPAVRLLRAMGGNAGSREFRCACLAAQALAAVPDGSLRLKEAYFSAVREEHISYPCVEKNIRALAEKLFRADTPAWRALWDAPPAERPSNGAFLHALARRLRAEEGGVP